MDANTEGQKELFQYIHKMGITKKNVVEKFIKWGRNDLINFYDQIFEMIPYTIVPEKHTKEPYNPFDFNASPVLSGGDFPCAGFDCRIKPADELARFAALYAEHTFIVFPVSDVRQALRSQKEVNYYLKLMMTSDFKMLFHYQPLLEEGIMGVSPLNFSLCEVCQADIIGGLKKIDKAIAKIAKDNRSKFNIQYKRDEFTNEPTVLIDGPEEFIGPHYTEITFQNVTKPYRKKNDEFWIKEVVRRGVAGIIHPYWNMCSYLTNYTPEIDVLRYTTNEAFPESNNELHSGFSHDLPFISNVSITKLLELRKKEGEAFNVYRDALRLALKSVEVAGKNKSKVVFNDIVLPELNKLDNTVKNSKKLMKRSLSEDLLISSGAIGLGLFAGLISPTLGACLTAIGGITSVSGIVKQAGHMLSEPTDIRDNSFYFLWKVRKEAGKWANKK